jgi:hypothetical protein
LQERPPGLPAEPKKQSILRIWGALSSNLNLTCDCLSKAPVATVEKLAGRDLSELRRMGPLRLLQKTVSCCRQSRYHGINDRLPVAERPLVPLR